MCHTRVYTYTLWVFTQIELGLATVSRTLSVTCNTPWVSPIPNWWVKGSTFCCVTLVSLAYWLIILITRLILTITWFWVYNLGWTHSNGLHSILIRINLDFSYRILYKFSNTFVSIWHMYCQIWHMYCQKILHHIIDYVM